MKIELPRMLYKFPGPVALQDGGYDTHIVSDESALDAAVKDGWHMTPADARKPAEVPSDKTTEPTRAELEQKATELGIEFKGTWGDKKIAAAIAEKLSA
jgi:hypothetical protein